jgi:hypothetical protein
MRAKLGPFFYVNYIDMALSHDEQPFYVLCPPGALPVVKLWQKHRFCERMNDL